MAGKVLIGGTAYTQKGGKCLIGGTAYSIKRGKTLVDGTVREIGLAPATVTVTIVGYGNNYYDYVVINGVTYFNAVTLQLAIGTTVNCFLNANNYGACYVYVNGTMVSFAYGSNTYSYTIQKPVMIGFEYSDATSKINFTEES